MNTGMGRMRHTVARTLVVTALALAVLWLFSHRVGFAWDADPAVAFAILIAVTVPALVLPALTVVLANPPAPIPMTSISMTPITTAPRPSVAAPKARAELQQPTRLPRKRHLSRRPRIVVAVPCIHCGENPKRLRRLARIRRPTDHAAPAPRRSLAARIAAVSPALIPPVPRRPSRIVRHR